MPIIKSEIINNTVQSDGTKRVQVVFTDHLNIKYYRSYDFYKTIVVNKAIANCQTNVEAGLKQAEINNAVNAVMNGKEITLEWCTWDEVKLYLQEQETKKQLEITQATDEKKNLSDKITEIGG